MEYFIELTLDELKPRARRIYKYSILYGLYAGFATSRVRCMFATCITEFATYHNRVRYLTNYKHPKKYKWQ